MQACPPSGPLEFLAISILGSLTKAKVGNRFLVVVNDRYCKQARAISMPKVTASMVTAVLMKHRIIPYEIRNTKRTDNGPQFERRFSATLCVMFETKILGTTVHHSQTNRQAERLHKTPIVQLWHSIVHQQANLDMHEQSKSYVYNTQLHRTSKSSSLSLILTQKPSGTLISARRSSCEGFFILISNNPSSVPSKRWCASHQVWIQLQNQQRSCIPDILACACVIGQCFDWGTVLM